MGGLKLEDDKVREKEREEEKEARSMKMRKRFLCHYITWQALHI